MHSTTNNLRCCLRCTPVVKWCSLHCWWWEIGDLEQRKRKQLLVNWRIFIRCSKRHLLVEMCCNTLKDSYHKWNIFINLKTVASSLHYWKSLKPSHFEWVLWTQFTCNLVRRFPNSPLMKWPPCFRACSRFQIKSFWGDWIPSKTLFTRLHWIEKSKNLIIEVFTVRQTSPNCFSTTVKLNLSVTIECQLTAGKADGRGIHAIG